ncbi:hypothetical protein [Mycolicibacter sinensis]|uniref:Secreted protein n=1 Tax=Mycolicibacter sinensis (strain JDM601) TaxID=875328 RepID=A0A1A2XY79_MYCSD|nr:hypothetical protein [Mycolicibacter sinensis]OBI29841.1 hypothetical protein A5710_20825 [Mycolicibacter sinensis]
MAQRQRLMVIAIRGLALAAMLITGLLTPAGAATADPLTQTDRQYLASLNHGGLCCPNQIDVPSPILKAGSSRAITTGRQIGTAMAANPTYANFQNWRNIVGNWAQEAGLYLNGQQAGQVVIIATHYYGGAAAECSLMKEMGGAMGEGPYWYGPVTYSGGLAVQPGCIDLSK